MIKINSLSKFYKKKLIIDDISFEVPDNSIVGLEGKNGAGKSTLINILGGLVSMDSGEILFDNVKLSKLNILQKKQIGCVFETPLYIEKLTGYEFFIFIAYMYDMPYNEANLRTEKILDFFELTQDSNKLIEEYSKGMKSKISLGIALIHKPKYLLLDEPFDGIDEYFKPKIIAKLKQLSNEGTSILLISHDREMLHLLCDFTLELKNGKLIELIGKGYL